ncbi:MOSC domain-containing protein [Aestuariibius sp. HNIBRBA575]|uniref:MOSC domain-containing protein n=1 Tax=Aestuariibius sp. HNIBRBA575 TaxID=3233343 RepID=UPI0034A4EB1B
MGIVANIWRHPIKSHGREALEEVVLRAGQAMPWDRHWAIAHEDSDADGSGWARCLNFSRGARAPQLAAIHATLDVDARQLTLTHPDLDDLVFWPDDTPDAAVAWSKPLVPDGRVQPARLVRAASQAMTDSKWPSVSILNLASLRDLSNKAGMTLDMRRFRGNIWLDGLAPWQEFDWIGKTIRIGNVTFDIREPIERCLHTHDNPETGARDGNTLTVLQSQWGHKNFGVFGAVTQDGDIRLGDKIEVL